MTENKEKFQVIINDQHELFINQTLHIISFDEESITIMTKSGKMMIEGRELKVESLNRETGDILIVGEIFDLSFSRQQQEKGKLFGRHRA